MWPKWTKNNLFMLFTTRYMRCELPSLPHAHLAVHYIRKVKFWKQVSHMEERLPVFFHNAVVTGHEREQRVIPQLLKTLHLILRELLQNGALICRLEVAWDEMEDWSQALDLSILSNTAHVSRNKWCSVKAGSVSLSWKWLSILVKCS